MLKKIKNLKKQPINKSTLLEIGSAVLSVLIVLLVTLNTSVVTINDQSGMVSVMSVGGNANQLITKAGIVLQENDTYETTRNEDGKWHSFYQYRN